MNIIENIVALWQRFTTDLSLTITICVSVLAFAVLYYYILKFLLANNSSNLVIIFVFVILIAGVILTFNPSIDNTSFLVIPIVMILIVVSLYTVEFKRMIWTKKGGKGSESRKEGSFVDEEKVQNCISEIIKAVQDMSKNDVGAIIVLSNGNIPSQILDSGVALDSDISSELIESVFFPKTPLHDGAMIINGTKIVSAGCFLPLSQQVDNIPKDLGTRHRAGLGVTENIDVVSIIVSEETGIITVAKAGKITRYADSQVLKKTLVDYYWQELSILRR